MLAPRSLIAPIVLHFLLGAVAFGAAAKTASPPARDVCSLLTTDEIKSVFGASTMVRKARPVSAAAPKATSCSFGIGPGSLSLSLEPTTRQEYEEFKKTLREVGDEWEPVSGIGDDAFLRGERVNVRVGNWSFVMWFGDPRGETPQRKQQVLALAKICAAKLR